MATTINSGYANSPKLTANIADHADVYGGRSLVFDGISDYLDLGTVNLDTSDFTISMWINFTSIGSYEDIFDNRKASTNGFIIRTSGGGSGIEVLIDAPSNLSITYNYTSTGQWLHLCVSVDRDGNMVLYANGKAEGTTDISALSSGTLNHDAGCRIGANESLTASFHGKMCDFKLFKGIAFSESQVQELYKKPESNPSNTTQYLERWYPMIESNPESPQSIVYDHSEKKLGSELVDNNTSSGWFDNSDSSTITNITDGVSIADDSGFSDIGYFRDSNLLNTDLTVGKLYKVQVDAYHNGVTTVELRIRDGASNQLINLTTTNTTYTRYIVVQSATNSSIRTNNHASGSIAYLTNLSVKEVLMGNHATTNFFGDELLTNDSTNWENSGAFGSVAYYSSGTNSGAGNIKQDGFTLSAGKTYQYSFAIGAGHPLRTTLKSYDGNVIYKAETDYAPNTTHTVTFVPSSDKIGLMFSVSESVSGDSNLTLSSHTLKEVGVSSSGFETAVNEPVVPQVPLMRYNQVMLFNGIDDYITGSSIGISGNATFSISFWAYWNGNSWVSDFTSVVGNSTQGTGLGLSTTFNAGRPALDFWNVRYRADNALDVQRWYHIAFTKTSGNISSTSKIYVNGIEVAGSLEQPDQAPNITDSNIVIGRLHDATNRYWNGKINEISIFNTALNQTQVQELFNDGVAYDATTHSQSANLIGYWRNDGVTTWKDRSTNSNDGTVQSTPDSITIREGLNSNRDGLGFYFTNPSSNVLRLNGVDEYVEVPKTGGINMSGGRPFTMSAWIKLDKLNADQAIMFSGAVSSNAENLLYVTSSNKIGWNNQGSNFANSSGTTISLGRWYHVAVTFNGTTTIKIYVDNDLDGTKSDCSGVAITDTSVLIGKRTHSNALHFNGLIDEARIYNRELSLAEIQKNYKHQKGKHKND